MGEVCSYNNNLGLTIPYCSFCCLGPCAYAQAIDVCSSELFLKLFQLWCRCHTLFSDALFPRRTSKMLISDLNLKFLVSTWMIQSIHFRRSNRKSSTSKICNFTVSESGRGMCKTRPSLQVWWTKSLGWKMSNFVSCDFTFQTEELPDQSFLYGYLLLRWIPDAPLYTFMRYAWVIRCYTCKASKAVTIWLVTLFIKVPGAACSCGIQ